MKRGANADGDPLLGPNCRQTHQAREAEAARQSTRQRGRDERWIEEGHRQRLANRAFRSVLAIRNVGNCGLGVDFRVGLNQFSKSA